MEKYCTECGGKLFYDSVTKRFTCKNCGLYITQDQYLDLKEKQKIDSKIQKRKGRDHEEYLEWWLSKKN